MESWVDKELEGWLPLEEEEPYRQVTRPFNTFPANQLSHIRNLKSTIREAITGDREAPEKWDKVEHYLPAFAKGAVPVSRSAQGQLILRTWQQDPNLAAAMLGSLHGEAPPGDKTIGTSVRAAALLAAHEIGYVATSDDEKAALQLLAADFSERFDQEYQRQKKAGDKCEALNELIEIDRKNMQTAYDTAFAEHAAEMKRIETTFREDMRLRAPASFWRKKRTVHLIVASISFAVFAGLIWFGLGIAKTEGPTFWNAVFDKTAGFALGPALLISIPALAYFWLLKLIARIFATNLASMASAGERATLISTFLALLLEDGGAMKDDERLLVLQAIFRPGPGEVSDEGPPANLLDHWVKRGK
jgi:hypothetical protein